MRRSHDPFRLILIPLVAGILSRITARSSTTGPALDLFQRHGYRSCPRRFPLVQSSLRLAIRPGALVGRAGLELDSATRHTLSSSLDGLSLLLLLLTFFLGIMSVLTSWTEIEHGVGFFHFNLMWVLAGVTGVFLSARSVPVLLVLGIDASADVFSDRDLGPRESHLRLGEVFPVHSVQRAADAGCRLSPLLSCISRATGVWTFDYRAAGLPRSAGGARRCGSCWAFLSRSQSSCRRSRSYLASRRAYGGSYRGQPFLAGLL